MTVRADALLAAAERLGQSQTGREALRPVLAWLNDSGLLLDGHNQQGLLLLVTEAWGGTPGTVRDLMREALA